MILKSFIIDYTANRKISIELEQLKVTETKKYLSGMSSVLDLNTDEIIGISTEIHIDLSTDSEGNVYEFKVSHKHSEYPLGRGYYLNGLFNNNGLKLMYK